MVLTAQDIATLSRLLDEVQGLDEAARMERLAVLTREHSRLAEPLRRLLEQKTGPLQDWVLPRLDIGDDVAAGVGDRVGPYRLVRPIGQGGMSSVWLADRADGQFERRVALKMPHRSGVPGVARLTQRERGITALLEHPHIARMYDAGVDERGQAYLAMAYVDGQPIDEWCARHGCTVRQRLQLFVQVLRAVAYAHGLSVIHRDIKPANILVDVQGQAHLLDFGIATRIDPARGVFHPTVEQARALTRRYASPEQVQGLRAGTAGDVYSLGVTLYELLTGTLPYELPRDTPAAMEEAILRGQLPPASTRTPDAERRRALRGDVDAILAHALARQPDRRYAGAAAMANDVERHLAGIPIQARRTRWHETAGRWAARHRAVILLLVSGGLVATAGIVATLWQMQRADGEAERARVVTQFVGELFQVQAGVSMGTAAATSGHSDQEKADPLATLIATRLAHDPMLQAELYGVAARAYGEVGAGRQAADFANRQLHVLDGVAGSDPLRAAALMQLATAMGQLGQSAKAESAAQAAVELLPDDLRAEGLEARAVLAALWLPMGQQARTNQLLAAVERSQPLDRRPASAGLAWILDVQATSLEIDNRFDDAIRQWRRAIDVARQAQGPRSVVASRIGVRMAMEELGRNRAEDARRDFVAAIDPLRAAGAAGQVQAAVYTSRFAALAFRMGHMAYAEAQAWMDDAREVVVARGRALPPSVLANVDVLRGDLALRHGELGQAGRLLLQAAPVAEASTDHLVTLRLLASYLGAWAMATGRHDQAAQWLQRRLELRVRSGDGASPLASYDWVHLAHNQVMKGDLAAADAILARAPTFGAQAGDAHAAGAAYAHAIREQRARIHLRRGDPAAARAAMPAPYGLEAFEDRSEPTLAPYALRGEVLCADGRPAEGLPYLEATLQALTPQLVPASPALARLRALAGRCALALGQRARAEAFAHQARAAFDAQPEVSGWYRLPLGALETALARGRHSPS